MSTPVPDETILGIIASEPQHGYQILQHFNENGALGKIWTMSTSQVYAVLKRLQDQKLIIGQRNQSPEGPPRTQFHITPKGENSLNAWLYDSAPSTSIRRIRIEFFSKIYVAELLKIPVSKIVNLQLTACEKQQKKISKKLSQNPPMMEKRVLEFIFGQLDSAIQWLKNFILTN